MYGNRIPLHPPIAYHLLFFQRFCLGEFEGISLSFILSKGFQSAGFYYGLHLTSACSEHTDVFYCECLGLLHRASMGSPTFPGSPSCPRKTEPPTGELIIGSCCLPLNCCWFYLYCLQSVLSFNVLLCLGFVLMTRLTLLCGSATE